MEGVECVCMRGIRRGRVSMHGRGCVYMEMVDCTCMGRGRMKGWCVRSWGEGGCVYMEGVECECMGRGCVYMEGVECVCMGEREDVCIWKGWSVCA